MSRPAPFLLTLALTCLSMIDNGKPPKFPTYQYKDQLEVCVTCRPTDPASEDAS